MTTATNSPTPKAPDAPAGNGMQAANASSVPASGTRRKGLTSFSLKVIAIIAMTCNHASHIFAAYLPGPALCVLLAVGGLTFPIMLFLIVEGYHHTSNVKRYAWRLFLFALVSQVPYWLFLAHQANVMFTLLGCLAILYARDRLENDLLFLLVFLGIAFLSTFCDWGLLGVAMVLVVRTVRNRKLGVAASALVPVVGNGIPRLAAFLEAPTYVNLGASLYALVGCTATVPLLWAYNGQRGRPLKWFFYVYYPGHILVLGLAKGLVLGDWS